jgi:amidase
MTDGIRQTIYSVARGEVSVQEVLEKKLQLITAKNPSLNALIGSDRARDSLTALGAHQRASARLRGLMFSARLSIDVAGFPSSDGSLTKEPYFPAASAALPAKLERLGAVCLGKGNTAERGKSFHTVNPRYGATLHPQLPGLSPGGSGGGDAAAIAAGMVDCAIGADAGGSVRVPANFCGIYGLSVTPGTLSEMSGTTFSAGVTRLFKNPGILARTVDDLDLVFSALSGFDPSDPYSIAFPPVSSALTPSTHCVVHSLNGVRPVPRVTEALSAVSQQLEMMGLLRSMDTPTFLDALIEPYLTLAVQAQVQFEDILGAAQGRIIDREREGPAIKILRERLQSELPPLTTDRLLSAWYQVDTARGLIAQTFSKIGIIVAPVCSACVVPALAQRFASAEGEVPTELAFQFSTMVNTLGLPALAMPCGTTPEGAPVGIQLIGPRHSEQLLIAIARRLEPCFS